MSTVLEAQKQWERDKVRLVVTSTAAGLIEVRAVAAETPAPSRVQPYSFLICDDRFETRDMRIGSPYSCIQ